MTLSSGEASGGLDARGEAALAALSAAFTLDPPALAALHQYVELLHGWRAGNITGVRRVELVLTHLVADALALLDVAELRRERVWADLGAGAGIPGLPLALAVPDARLALIESVGKKCTFLRAAVEATGVAARVTVICARSEEHAAPGAPGRGAYPLVLARAVGPLPTALELAAPLLAPGGAALIATSEERVDAEQAAGRVAASRCGLALERIERLTRSPLHRSVCIVARSVSGPPEWLPRRAGRARSHPFNRT